MVADKKDKITFSESLKILFPFLISIFVVITALVLLLIYPDVFRSFSIINTFDQYDEMIVADGFHSISLENGQRWKLTYEQSHDRVFEGLIRHTSRINSTDFAILSHDILVTSGDYANPELVSTGVSNHHFTWRSQTSDWPAGHINLLHTVPMNQEIFSKLAEIKNGDNVIIIGWDILRIEGWDQNSNPVGYWQDAGCNTTLVTDVIINP